MKVFRIVTSLLLIALLCLSPYFWKQSQRDFFAELNSTEPPHFSGTVTLYHIVSERTYAGSLTNWLQMCADQYEKKHRGTHIQVEGMTEPYYLERVEYGRLPDAYSFFSGTLSEDALQPILMTSEGLREGLFDTAYAVPYCFTGYASIRSDQNDAPMPEPDPAATIIMENGAEENAVITDLRSIGDRLRDESGGGSYSISAAGNYTDAVCWLGIAKGAPELYADALRGFFAYLQEAAQQRTLSQLGAFSVLDTVEPESAYTWMKDLSESYKTVSTFDPFRMAAQRDALISDAWAAISGDSEAKTRFQERIKQILRK